MLIRRDLSGEPEDQEVEDIKILVVATIIMEITRNFVNDEKRHIKAFLDKLLFNRKLVEAKEKHEEIIPSLKDYHYSQIDAQRITSVKYLKDMLPIKGRHKLMEWYKMPNFVNYYKQCLNDIIAKEGQILRKQEMNIMHLQQRQMSDD